MSERYSANPQLVIDNLLNEVANLQRRNAILSALVTQMEQEIKGNQEKKTDNE